MKKIISPNSLIIQICQKLHEKKLVSAYGGNVSIRTGNKVIITPKGSSLAEITEDDLVVIDLNGNVLFGTHPPSSEMMLHLKVYHKRQDINAVVHTHPPASTAFAYVNRKIKPINPESQHFLKEIPVVPYQIFGSKELADACGQYLNTYDVVLLEKHGLVTIGSDLNIAYNLSELAEETALMNMYVILLNQLATD